MKKIYFLFLAFYILIQQNIQAQSPGCLWSVGFTNSANFFQGAVAADAQGYTYLALDYQTSADVLIKYDSLGNQVFGINDTFGGMSVAIDPHGNIWTVGKHRLKKRNNAGIKKMDITTGANELYCVHTDTRGYVYVTGSQQASSDNVFIAKYDTTGSLLFTKTLGAGYHDKGQGITTDAEGNIYVCGIVNETSTLTVIATIDFDPGFPGNTSTPTGPGDGFLLKLDSGGNYLWHLLRPGDNGSSTSYYSNCTSVDVDNNGYVYLAYTSRLEKLSATGSTIALAGTGGEPGSAPEIVKVDRATGNLFLSNRVRNSSGYIDFGNGVHTYDAGVYSRPCLLKFDNNLNPWWCKVVKAINGNYNSYGVDVVNGKAVWAGQFGDYQAIVNICGNEYGQSNATPFVARFQDCSYPSPPTSINGPTQVTSGSTVTYTASGGSGTYYSWSFPMDWIKVDSLSDNDHIALVVGANGAATVSVASSNHCNNSAPLLLGVQAASCAPTSSVINATACSSYTTPSSNHTYTSSGTYTDTILNAAGCDSVITINLTIKEPTTGSISASICQGESYFFNGANRTTTGAYLDTLVNASGCDSILTLNLTVKQTSTGTIIASICQGESYLFNGANRTATGAYLDTLVNAVGCDSILTLNLTVKQISTGSVSASICQGESYLFNGIARTTTGAYLDTLVNAVGCDSLLTLNLTVNPLPAAAINGPTTICSGLSATLTASGGTGYSWDNGLGTNTQVTVTPTNTTTYTVTVTDGNNCSATAAQTISVTNTPTADITGPTQICTGESATLTANGGNTYQWANGLGTNATITPSPTGTTTYTVTATIGANCSATATHTVTVYQPAASQFSQTICAGQSYTYNGIALTTAGAYSDTLQTVNGCDSIVTLNLTVNAVLTGSFNQAICTGSSYTFNGVALTQAGAYTDTLQTSSGCDSIITLTLSINPTPDVSITPNDSVAVCQNDSVLISAQPGNPTYLWSTGATTVSIYAQFAGNYTVTVTNINNCSAVSAPVTLSVNALPAIPVVTRVNDTLTTSAADDYQWYFNNGQINGANNQTLTITENGNYYVEITDANGCQNRSAVYNATNVNVKDIIGIEGLKLYPNPNSGQFMLEFSNAASREVEITNALGQLVFDSRATAQITAVNADLAAGVYFVRVKQNGQSTVIKMSIVR